MGSKVWKVPAFSLNTPTEKHVGKPAVIPKRIEVVQCCSAHLVWTGCSLCFFSRSLAFQPTFSRWKPMTLPIKPRGWAGGFYSEPQIERWQRRIGGFVQPNNMKVMKVFLFHPFRSLSMPFPSRFIPVILDISPISSVWRIHSCWFQESFQSFQCHDFQPPGDVATTIHHTLLVFWNLRTCYLIAGFDTLKWHDGKKNPWRIWMYVIYHWLLAASKVYAFLLDQAQPEFEQGPAWPIIPSIPPAPSRPESVLSSWCLIPKLDTPKPPWPRWPPLKKIMVGNIARTQPLPKTLRLRPSGVPSFARFGLRLLVNIPQAGAMDRFQSSYCLLPDSPSPDGLPTMTS